MFKSPHYKMRRKRGGRAELQHQSVQFSSRNFPVSAITGDEAGSRRNVGWDYGYAEHIWWWCWVLDNFPDTNTANNARPGARYQRPATN